MLGGSNGLVEFPTHLNVNTDFFLNTTSIFAPIQVKPHRHNCLLRNFLDSYIQFSRTEPVHYY